MAYTAPTPAELKVRFAPTFAAVADARVQIALDRAARMVDESWPEADFKEGRMLWAAHQLTIEGLGTMAASGGGSVGALKRRKAGDHEEEFAVSDAQTLAVTQSGPNGSTVFGRQFDQLARIICGGPLVTGGGAAPCNALGRDVPQGPFFPFRGW